MSTTCAPTLNAVVSWLKPGVEAERQCREDHVVGRVAEVVADALGPDDQVAVARARRPSACRCCPTCRGSPPCRCRSRGVGASAGSCEVTSAHAWSWYVRPPVARGVVADHDDVLDRGQSASSSRSSARRSAVVTRTRTSQSFRMYPTCWGSQHRVDRDEDAAGGRAAEDRLDRLDPLVEVDRDALARSSPSSARPPANRATVPRARRTCGVRRVRDRRVASACRALSRRWCNPFSSAPRGGRVTKRGTPARCRGSRSGRAPRSGYGTSSASASGA